MKLLKISLIFFLLFTWAHAESIKSITGNIILDINNDGTSEVQLNSSGLAIGSGLSPSTNLHLQGSGIITGDLVIGGTAGNSTLEVQGTMGYVHQTVSSNTTLSGNSIVLVDSKSANVTITLPYAGNVLGRQYRIKKTSTSNQVEVNGGGNQIDANDIYTLSSGNTPYLNLISNGNQWFVLSQSSNGVSASDDIVASENLIGWWKFDETSGTTAVDSSGQGNDGTLTNMNDSDWVSGKIGNALEFDGSNDYVNLGNDSSITNFGSGNFSINLWFSIASFPDWGSMFRIGRQGTNVQAAFETMSSSHVAFNLESNSGSQVNTDIVAVTANTWYHGVAVIDRSSNNMYIYIDGALIETESISAATGDVNSSDSNIIGASRNGGGGVATYFTGKIDDVRIYSKALTASEISALYNEGQ